MRPMRRGPLVAVVAALLGSVVLTGVTAAAGDHRARQPYTWHNAPSRK